MCINYLPDILCILSHLYFTTTYKESIVIKLILQMRQLNGVCHYQRYSVG